jgi:DNA gyrase subunit A
MIKADCEEMRARYNSPRFTRIEDADVDIDIAALIPVAGRRGDHQPRRVRQARPARHLSPQGRGGKGIIASDAKDDDFIEHVFVASTHDDLLCFTNTGRVFKKQGVRDPGDEPHQQGPGDGQPPRAA